MGLGCIPWDSVNAYAKRYGLSLEEQEDLWFFVAGMDNSYLARVNNANAKRSSPKNEELEEGCA